MTKLDEHDNQWIEKMKTRWEWMILKCMKTIQTTMKSEKKVWASDGLSRKNQPDNVDCKLIWKARTGKWRISGWIKKAWPDNVDRGLIWKSVAVAYAVAYAAHDSQPDWLWTRLLIVGYTSVQIRVHQYTSVQISIHQYTSVSISTHQYTRAHKSGPMRGICHMRGAYAGICHMRTRLIMNELIMNRTNNDCWV